MGVRRSRRPWRASEQGAPRRARRLRYHLAATALVVGGVVMTGTAVASASPTIGVTPSTALTNGQVIVVAGSGLTTSTYGYLLECNDAPSEPTVNLGAPFDVTLPVGCSPPSLKHLVVTGPSGDLAATFGVLEGRKFGPPCGPYANVSGCSGLDSAKKKPGADAQNYPCPPSPAQETAGVTCSIVFIDSSGDRASTQIAFQGGGPPAPTTTTTVAKTTTTTAAKKTSATTTTTKATTTAATGSSGTPTTAVPTPTASSQQLAFTGPGPALGLLFLTGVAVTLLGVLLWLGLAWQRAQRRLYARLALEHRRHEKARARAD